MAQPSEQILVLNQRVFDGPEFLLGLFAAAPRRKARVGRL